MFRARARCDATCTLVCAALRDKHPASHRDSLNALLLDNSSSILRKMHRDARAGGAVDNHFDWDGEAPKAQKVRPSTVTASAFAAGGAGEPHDSRLAVPQPSRRRRRRHSTVAASQPFSSTRWGNNLNAPLVEEKKEGSAAAGSTTRSTRSRSRSSAESRGRRASRDSAGGRRGSRSSASGGGAAAQRQPAVLNYSNPERATYKPSARTRARGDSGASAAKEGTWNWDETVPRGAGSKAGW